MTFAWSALGGVQHGSTLPLCRLCRLCSEWLQLAPSVVPRLCVRFIKGSLFVQAMSSMSVLLAVILRQMSNLGQVPFGDVSLLCILLSFADMLCSYLPSYEVMRFPLNKNTCSKHCRSAETPKTTC